MSELPTGWAHTTFEFVLDYVQRGKSPKYADKSELPVINQKCVRWWGIQEEFLKFIRTDQIDTYTEERFLREGDVLWNSTGTGTIGRAAFFQGLEIADRAVVDSHITILRSSAAIDPKFLFNFIKSTAVQNRIGDMQSGTTNQVELSKTAILKTDVQLPPLAEQKRITAKLDALSARVTAARTKLIAVAKLVEKYKAEVLTLGVQGGLTREWRAENDARWGKPERLEKHVLDVRYGSSAKSSKTGEIPVLRMGNIQSMELDWSNLVFTDRPEEIEKYRLEPGDVLFNRTNSPELVGKTAIYRGEQPAIYAGYLIRVKCAETLLPEYLNYALNSSVGRTYCWLVKSDSVSQSNINAQKLKAFEFVVPTIDEQQQIIIQIKGSFSKIDSLAAEAEKALKLTDQLDERILNKAFAGELVAQDPNDEPASMLLDRIREARAKAPKSKKQPRKLRKMKKKPTLASLLDSWPSEGMTFEELRGQASGTYDQVKEELFELMIGDQPKIHQEFDSTQKTMRLKKVAP
ncbi:restriction endonuclease subunit S [uncultured Cohaesibacter sp.]|uniref:restriction endonuclease subunit S n=1 Tax=uncultured Cohaesibacter sp. TaxID=1002546 RepID=UPI002AA5FED7|nr:restriction endonuclease subunit S [uncultured Cohaesibacter sp.]